MEINYEKADKELSLREKMSIKILMAMLQIIFPCQYTHQFEKFKKELLEDK